MSISIGMISDEVKIMAESWPLYDSLLGGTSAMRESGETYLPKWPNEEDAAYKFRLRVSTLYPAFERTVETLSAKPFSKPLTYKDDVPEEIKQWCENIDFEGNNLHVFSANLMHEAMSYGFGGVLVDYPPSDGVRTKAQEKALGLRPFVKYYPAKTILGWKTKMVNGVRELSQIRLLESISQDKDEFSTEKVEQVRVIESGLQRVFRKSKSTDASKEEKWVEVVEERRTTTMLKIPFVFIYGKKIDFGVGKSPLSELAHQNVEHWQSKSDQQNILHIARVPVLVCLGGDDKTTITVGASQAIQLPKDGDLKWVEHGGKAIEAGRNDLKDIEQRMLHSGAELLVQREVEATATEISSEGSALKCELQSIAERLEDSVNQILQFIAEWVGLSEGGHVQVFKEFGVASFDEAICKLLVEMNMAGLITKKTLLEEFQKRGIISDDVNIADELAAIEDEGPEPGNTPPDPRNQPDPNDKVVE